MKRTRILSLISAIFAFVIFSASAVAKPTAKYVFLFIGDGMGTSHVDVTESYLSYKAGNVVLEDVSQRLTVDGKEVSLLKKEFDILKYFMMRPGHTVDKAVLAEAVWGDHIDQTDDFQFVYAQMKNLRKKLAEAGADIEIKSIYGFGYKLMIP